MTADNLIANAYPQLAREWASGHNGDRTPENTTYGSNQKITWQCHKGHLWTSTPNTRTRGGKVRPCPYCAGRRPIPGETDFATRHPTLVHEWAYDLNVGLDPAQLLPGSDKKVWWRCAQGHEWQTRINTRTLNKTSCPVCSNHMVYLDDYNVASYPEILVLWDSTKNDVEPEDVYVSSTQEVWWQCRRRHSWKASTKNVFEAYRHSKQYGDDDFACDKCAKESSTGRKPRPFFPDVFPHLLDEWDWDKNAELGKNPHQLTVGSEARVWWVCRAEGHSWQTQVRSRTKGSNCPYCGNKKLLTGFNDLQTVNPSLAERWHPTLNGELTPSDIMATSHQKVHWLCEKGHHSFTSPSAKSAVKNERFSCLECHNSK